MLLSDSSNTLYQTLTETTTATATPTCGAQILKNGGFDNGYDGWTIRRQDNGAFIKVTSDGYSGNAISVSCDTINYPSNAPDGYYSKLWLTQDMATCPGVTYDVSIALKIAGNPAYSNSYFLGGFGDGNIYYQDNFGLSNPTGYNVLTTSFTAKSTTELAQFIFVAGVGTMQTWVVDSVTVTPRS